MADRPTGTTRLVHKAEGGYEEIEENRPEITETERARLRQLEGETSQRDVEASGGLAAYAARKKRELADKKKREEEEATRVAATAKK